MSALEKGFEAQNLSPGVFPEIRDIMYKLQILFFRVNFDPIIFLVYKKFSPYFFIKSHT